MRIRASALVASCFAIAFLSQTIPACIWDRDTLAMERRRFPSAFELITGKFLRHSEEFYRWRIKDRLGKLKTLPNTLSYYDDLAVAYDKIGQHEKAIETMLEKEKLRPGLYETFANLGTFYIHAGQYKQGLEYIDKAIKINPNAHFGREVYQRHLVEYLMSRTTDGKAKLPLRQPPQMSFHTQSDSNFVAFLTRKKAEAGDKTQGKSQHLTLKEIKAAVKGVLGMMKFGNHRSPVLLEALADLLRAGSWDDDAKQLAVRAYLKASFEVSSDETRQAYRRLAAEARNTMPMGRPDQSLNKFDESLIAIYEAQLKKELAAADAWYAKVKNDELKWISTGRNPELEFERKYYSVSIALSSRRASRR